MTRQWQSVELGSLAQFRNGLNYTQAARGRGGLPIVGVKDFQSRSFVEFSDLEELDATSVDPGDLTIKKGDILFVRSNGNRQLIGRSLLVQDEPKRSTTYSGFTIRLRFTDSRCDPSFYAYVLRGPLIRQVLSSQGGGTNISNLNQGILARLVVPFPPQDEQRRIASILGAYDDLIEVNRRRIALLEEMARRLYEEWFVRFRFPGHEANTRKNLPEGWQMLPLSQIATIVGESMSPALSPDQTFCHYSFPAFDGGRLPAKERGDIILSNKLEFSEPCVLIGKLNPRIPRVWYVPTNTDFPQIASTEFIPLTPTEKVPLSLLYAYLKSEKFAGTLRGLSQGTSTSHQRVRPKDVLNIHLPVPPEEVLSKVGRYFSSIFGQLEILLRGNANLSESRDLILPRLVSGELSVSSAERELEAVA